MTARRGLRTPRVGGAARAAVVLVGLGSGALAACGETRALILGEVPFVDSGVSIVDAGLLVDVGAPVDAGCAACSLPIALTGTSQTTQYGGDSGTTYTDTCPSDQAVIGYQGFLTPPAVGLLLVGAIQAVCGKLASSEAPPYALSTTAGATLPVRGISQTGPWTQSCPPDQVVVGFEGNSGDAFDQVAFVCAPWSAAGGTPGGALTMGTPTSLSAIGGDGGMPFHESCPSGQLAIGSNLRAGEWIDAFGLVCATPTTVAGDGGP
jgi:hypothetical protein